MNKQIALAIAALAMSGAAAAQTYGVVSVGASKHDVDCEGFASCDKSGTAVKLIGGYKVRPNLAIEVGYLNFGESSLKDTDFSAKLKIDGLMVGGAFHHEFATHWNFVARLGVASMKAKGQVVDTGVTTNYSDRKAQLYGGLGIGYKLSKNLSLDLSMDLTKAEVEGEKGNVAGYGVGLTFGF